MPNIINQILLNRYRVINFIASGGMGTVYRVWDLERNVFLAMKVLRNDLAEDPHIFKQFEREANALKKLDHPNIVPFYGMYRTRDIVFLLERYIDGPSLKEILRKKGGTPLSIQETLIYFKALSSALGYAHAKGVVHCDVKPGNILLDRGGNIYLADFGIARHADSTTTTIVGAGTAAYMAPEQILEEPLTSATDVYALGIMLFEMLTGQRPFQGNEAGTEKSGQLVNERIRYAQVNLHPPDPRSINKSIPVSLASIILRCLDKRPEYRYRTAIEFFMAVSSAANVLPENIADSAGQQSTGDTIVSPPEPEPVRKSRYIIPLLAGVIVTGLLAVCGVSVLALVNRPTSPVPFLDRTAVSTDIPVSTVTPQTTNTIFATVSSSPTPNPSPTPTSTEIPPVIVHKGAEMVLVPLGEFTMGNTSEQALAECQKLFPNDSDKNCKTEYFVDETPPHTVFLASFYIDKYEVSNRLYQTCMEAGRCSPPVQTSSETHAAYYGSNQFEEYPVIWVDWYMAKTFCEWRDARLPTEAEWEKAARGTLSLLYPWGNTFTGPEANSCDTNCPKTFASKFLNDGYTEIAPVNAFPEGVSTYGAFNLSGNVSEWVSDWYSESYYTALSVLSGTAINPQGPQSGDAHVLRGGSWARYPINLRLVTRTKSSPDYSANDLGFRCAVSVP